MVRLLSFRLSLLLWGALSLTSVSLQRAHGFQSGTVELRDFRNHELKYAGITLSKESTVHIKALGGGEERSFWGELFGEDGGRPQMYATGWIIDAVTREPVWEMTLRKTSGRSNRREFDGEITLKAGSYEIYYVAYAYARHKWSSNNWTNIDRRPTTRKTRSGKTIISGSSWENDDLRDEFMDVAQDYGITVTPSDPSTVERFTPPFKSSSAMLSAVGLGDEEAIKKTLTISDNTPVHIYALGEGRRRDGMFDYGWIVRADTRERVWEMTPSNCDRAGGNEKNIKFKGDITLPKGTYELYYVTDGSHSSDDWNARPPFDPLFYGISLSPVHESDRNRITMTDGIASARNPVVELIRVRDDEYVSAGFRLKSDATLRVYALGEWDSNEEFADYGWIVNASTRQRVWDMKERNTYHAGGADKNRMADEIISLPKGDYVAYYQTDDSHSYDDWNSDAPFDEEHWGLSIYGSGERFDPSTVTSFKEEDEQNVIAQIVRVHDDKHLTKRFTLDKPTKVRIYAIGEGENREMFDYGWIEDAGSGRTVWEMTYNMTERAGGARKNRAVTATLLLDKGEYELHYETDGSHSFNDWNSDPPEDRTHWGISVYKE